MKLIGDRDVEVTLTGPIAAKYSSATEDQKQALGKPLTGDHNAGTRDSGVVFQQFQGGVIVAKNERRRHTRIYHRGQDPGSLECRARPEWHSSRSAARMARQVRSAFPPATRNAVGDLLVSSFEHGKVEYNAKTGQVEVTVNGKVVPSGL